MLLRSNDSVLDELELPKRVEWMRGDGTQDMPTSPLKAIEETQFDPFYYLRAACQSRHGEGLYSLELPPRLRAFSCHLDDEWVPGTEAFAQREADWRLLAGEPEEEPASTRKGARGG